MRNWVFKRKLAVLLTFLFFSSLSFASNEKIHSVEMFECKENFCVKLVTSTLYKSSLGTMYAFGPSEIQIHFEGELIQKEFSGFEGTYDPQIGRFYLSKKGESKEYLIDAKDRKVYSFLAN